MNEIKSTVQAQLLAMQDLPYKAFQCKLMPTVEPKTVIGIRTPALRKFARAYGKTSEAAQFLRSLPHRYYEENNLHGLLIGQMQDFSQAVEALDAFLPYVDNWATCDLIRPKVFGTHPPALLPKLRQWIGSGQIYTVRFGLEMLMVYYLDEAFDPAYLELAASVRSEEYYVNMMIAWFFATALAKQYDATLPYLQERRLDPWTHNKTIQKAIESYRIQDAQKAYLRTLRQKLPRTAKQDAS